jgi:predicted transcriptional regulator
MGGNTLKITEIIKILDAEVICGGEPELEIHTACGSDLMSDVLAFVKDQGMLLTGLMNPQVVRTAEMLDMRCIAFVRGKQPAGDIIELAKQRGITLLSTGERMFTACGKLFSAGLGGGCDD